MEQPRIQLNVDGHVAVVSLNRPDKLNAIDSRMLDELRGAIESIERSDGIRAVVVTGEGDRAFSVGADVHEWSGLSPWDMWRIWTRRGHAVIDMLDELRQPVIAAIDGFAFGGGLELALAADLRLASAGSEFCMPEVTLGTIPGWGGASRLIDVIGRSRAKQMILTAARITAEQAAAWGLVNEVVPKEQIMARALELAQAISFHPARAVQIAKESLQPRGPVNRDLEGISGALTAFDSEGAAKRESFLNRKRTR